MAESEDNRDEAEQPDGHAVPTEDAREIAGSAEDAALEAYEEAEEATVDVPPAEPQAAEAAPEAQGEPAAQAPAAGEVHEAHAVPSEDAREIAGSAEDAALEAYEEAEDAAAGAQADAPAPAATQQPSEETEDEEWEEAPAPREKPVVPGAHLEVDIVPEGVDPLGRGETQEYVDPYAIVEAEDAVVEEAEEPRKPTRRSSPSRSPRPRSTSPRAPATGPRASARPRSPASRCVRAAAPT